MSSVGQDIEAANARWSFGGSVANTFEEHIERSVPYYREGHQLVAAISDYFLYEGARAYEIGCSTAALLRLVAERHAGRSVNCVGIEVEETMAQAARERSRHLPLVEIVHDDAFKVELEPCDFIMSYYTMQFVRPALRQLLFDKLYASLRWGGALVVFEKVRAPDARFQDMMSALYVDYKLEQGFSEAEIIGKSRSLKGVLEPFSSQANVELMQRAGFVDVMTVFKHVCFEGFVAIK